MMTTSNSGSAGGVSILFVVVDLRWPMKNKSTPSERRRGPNGTRFQWKQEQRFKQKKEEEKNAERTKPGKKNPVRE